MLLSLPLIYESVHVILVIDIKFIRLDVSFEKGQIKAKKGQSEMLFVALPSTNVLKTPYDIVFKITRI